MHRNAISTGLVSLLLGIVALLWAAPLASSDAVTAGIVANVSAPATTHTAAVRRASPIKRPVFVPSANKVRRSLLAAATVTPPPAAKPAAATILPIVDQPTITENHKKIATSVLNALPAGCRDNLETFAVLYKGATRRGLGGKTTIILDGSVPDAEFAALLVHECGHVIHGNMPGTPASGLSAYADGPNPFYADSPMVAFWKISWKSSKTRLAGREENMVSGYALSDPFEEFAETFALYVLQRDEFRERAKTNDAMAAKLFWMDVNLPLPENAVGTGTADWDGTVPWDVTKLPLTLAAR